MLGDNCRLKPNPNYRKDQCKRCDLAYANRTDLPVQKERARWMVNFWTSCLLMMLISFLMLLGFAKIYGFSPILKITTIFNFLVLLISAFTINYWQDKVTFREFKIKHNLPCRLP